MIETPGAFGVRETHGILWRPEHRILAASDGLGWSSVYASLQREAPYEDSFSGVRDHLVILHLDGPVPVSRALGTGRTSRVVPPGGIFLLPGGLDFGVRLGGSLSSFHLYLRDAVLKEVAAEMVRGDPAHVELVPRLGDQDALIEALAGGVRGALGAGDPASVCFVDHAARTLAARLLLAHSAAPPATGARARPQLVRPQLARAIDYVEANLDKTIGLPELASAAGLSPVHFARAFKRAMGVPPHQFILRTRVERAKRLLANTHIPIAHIAAECGFCHQEHLTRAFRRLTGTTPAAFRAAAA